MLPHYCQNNDSFIYIWEGHGFSQCFGETISTSVLFVWIGMCWAVEMYLYRKYSIRVEMGSQPRSCQFKLQILVTLLLPLIALVRFVLQSTVLYSRTVYGYMILSMALSIVFWPLSLGVILIERRYALPSIPTWGHSIAILLFWTLAFISENLAFLNLHNESWWFGLTSLSDKIEFGLFVVRYICTFALFLLGLKAPGIISPQRYLNLQIQHRPLVDSGESGENSSVTVHQRSTFHNMFKKLKLLLPFLWPKKSILLQFYLMLCIGCLIAGRVVNLFTPLYYKKIVDSLTSVKENEGLVYRWDLILMYGFLMFLQGGGTGGMGFLSNARSFLWIRIQQYTTRELQLQLFAHLHSLSLSWHLKRKTGEVLRAVDRGTSSINNLLNYMLFNIAPTIADILIAIIYFITFFNAWFGLIIFITMAFYLGATIWLTEWRTQYRRSMNKLDNAANSRAVDSLLNFETVKYYGAEGFEVDKYGEAICEYQQAEWKSSASMTVLNMSQSAIITTGLLSSALLCAHLVVTHQGLTSGDYVLLGTYILQLYLPLNWFGTYYRLIQTSFIDMENMFDLLGTDRDVHDVENAPDIQVNGGGIEFSNIWFSYVPERSILKGISFSVKPGQTVALVGPTGSGKTTVVRLLFRFYDVQKGAILIDGQNIAEISQVSLRKSIGVVPQDTVLFNNTIKYNIHYGRVTASDEEVEQAAQASEIHDQILIFPDGYQTIVGERGLKLSGGEKQRIAIARTILKAPIIVLLDEATSALDTKTERQIQSSLEKICANRTTLVVAHRLSTIIDADEILVLKEGEIVERGGHQDLLAHNGLYAAMWYQQLESKEEELETSESQIEELIPVQPQGHHHHQ